MVNQSSLVKIIRQIDGGKLRPMMRWRNREFRVNRRQSNYSWNLRRNVRRLLKLISGDDIVEMLKCKTLVFSFAFVRVF